MIALLQDYWPLLAAVGAALVCIWGVGWIEWHRGRITGRAEVFREMRHAERGGWRP